MPRVRRNLNEETAMPELPDVELYRERLGKLLAGRTLDRVQLASPFVLRTVEPPLARLEGRRVTGSRRLGKRIILGFDDDLYLVVHLMIAGRLRWRDASAGSRAARIGGRFLLASFDFEHGTLYLTEAGTKRRAMLHVVEGAGALSEFDRGGLDVLEIDGATFAERLRAENHTLKRSLTDPRLFSGIGNAYSDEILHRARLSPLLLSQKLDDGQIARLYQASREILQEWLDRLRAETTVGLPEKVTAFRPEMAVHGRYGEPCPVCGAPVQRIRYAANETNYCVRCQTGGRLLADRAMSRLLKDDWPRSIDEPE
jgi:formamidopyrimidine-DNA glycosylase